VIRAGGAPWQLVRWQQERAIEAALELDEQPDEDRPAYLRRVIGKASEIAAEAAATGTEIHKQLELYWRGEAFDPFWKDHVLAAADALEQAVLLAEGEEIDLDDLPLAQAPPAAEAIRLLLPGVTLAELERFATLVRGDVDAPKRPSVPLFPRAQIPLLRERMKHRIERPGAHPIAVMR